MAIETSQKQNKALSKIEMNGVNKMARDRASPVGAREQLDDGDGADQGVTTVTARLRSDFGVDFPTTFPPASVTAVHSAASSAEC